MYVCMYVCVCLCIVGVECIAAVTTVVTSAVSPRVGGRRCF